MSAMVEAVASGMGEAMPHPYETDQLEKIPLGRMYAASQKAVVRLHLFATAQIHERLLEFERQARATLLKNANKEGKLDSWGGYHAQQAILKDWRDWMTQYAADLQGQRREAAAIPFGVLAVMHDRLVRPVVEEITPLTGGASRTHVRDIAEAGSKPARLKAGVFEPQLQALLHAAAEHIYGDGLNLSARIWQMDRDTQEGINRVLMNGITNGDSAWNIAKQLEQYLGANEDCPRWTSTRLYNRTKAEIAKGDLGGLLSGDACDGQGVSYNALRLARTEIQRAHAQATDQVLAMQPWVQEEQTNLSPAHAETDECDDVAHGGEHGEGIYPVGTIEYPLHPHCLCYKTAVMMPQDEFTANLRGWLHGTESWPRMDAYANEIGGGLETEMVKQPVSLSLAVWLFGQALEAWMK
jgi:hypothetical protein